MILLDKNFYQFKWNFKMDFVFKVQLWMHPKTLSSSFYPLYEFIFITFSHFLLDISCNITICLTIPCSMKYFKNALKYIYFLCFILSLGCMNIIIWEGLSRKDKDKVVRERKNTRLNFRRWFPQLDQWCPTLSMVGIQHEIHSNHLFNQKNKIIN